MDNCFYFDHQSHFMINTKELIKSSLKFDDQKEFTKDLFLEVFNFIKGDYEKTESSCNFIKTLLLYSQIYCEFEGTENDMFHERVVNNASQFINELIIHCMFNGNDIIFNRREILENMFIKTLGEVIKNPQNEYLYFLGNDKLYYFGKITHAHYNPNKNEYQVKRIYQSDIFLRPHTLLLFIQDEGLENIYKGDFDEVIKRKQFQHVFRINDKYELIKLAKLYHQ